MAQPTIAEQRSLQLPLLPQKKTTFRLPKDLYTLLKVESAKRDMEMSAIVADALRKYFMEVSDV